jgi:mono/diheme cytochrome c family protein
MKSRSGRIGLVVLIVFGLAQLVPYGRAHENPPTKAGPTWDSPETRELFFRVCRDCHSNETTWPWYSSVAPMSWLVQYDVDEGRSHFNVSRWGEGKQDGDEAAEELREGEMPPWFYLPLHPEADLSPDERRRFISGLEQTFGTEDDDEEGDHGEDEH